MEKIKEKLVELIESIPEKTAIDIYKYALYLQQENSKGSKVDLIKYLEKITKEDDHLLRRLAQ